MGALDSEMDYFATTVGHVGSDKNNQWILNTGRNFDEEHNICMHSKYFSADYFSVVRETESFRICNEQADHALHLDWWST